VKISIHQELIDLGIKSELITFFLNYKLPILRKAQTKNKYPWPHIEVGGDCLRIGKTTTKQVLTEQIGSRGFPFVFVDEDWKSNTYLKDSYQGSSLSILNSQKWFAHKKLHQLKTISNSSFWIQVVHPEMDFCYAMTNYLIGNLSKKHWLLYEEYYQSLPWNEIPRPDLLIYLTAKPNTIISRFKHTARNFETVDDVYIRVMQIVNQQWLSQAHDKYHILKVNTDNFDFSYDTGTTEMRKKLGDMLFTRLLKEGWDFKSI
jgi:deoxyadenosine/deoxycytidine kinase